MPGDIVLLDAGDRVPADGRLIAAFSLEIDESTLTGESLPDGKQVAGLAKPDTPLAERLNMTYMNTMVTRGRAEMLVTATGMLTEMGRLSLQLASVEEGPSPLQLQLDELGKRLAMIAGALVGLPEPFTAIQILWVAMIMDGPPAVALALDAARPGIMREPPRSRDARMLTLRRLGKIIAFGTTMMVGTLAVLYYGVQNGTAEHALTLAFTTFVLFQFFNVFNARAETGSSFNRHFFDNRMLWASLPGVVALQAVAVHWSAAQAIFRTTALTPGDWLVATAVAASVLLLEEARKLALRVLKPQAREGTDVTMVSRL